MTFDIPTLLATLTLGSVVERVIEEAEDLFLESSKDAIGDKIKEVFKRNPNKKIEKKILASFVFEFETELISCGSSPFEIKKLANSTKIFLKKNQVHSILVGRLEIAHQIKATVAASELSSNWMNIVDVALLPEDFSWPKLLRRMDASIDKMLREDESLRELGSLLSLLALAGSSSRPADRLDLDSYANSIKRRFRYLKLEFLDANPDHQPITLQSVYVDPKLLSISRQKFPQLEASNNADDSLLMSSSSISGLSLLGNFNKTALVVLGNPGSGKSSLLAHFCLQWAVKLPKDRLLDSIPIHIDLRHFAGAASKDPSLDILKYLQGTLGAPWKIPYEETRELLDTGKATLLLDGLDEIFDPTLRSSIAMEISRLKSAHERARIVVTSRIVGFSLNAPILFDAGFDVHVILPLYEDQTLQLIDRWHATAYADPITRIERSAKLVDAIESTPAVREMAKSPLLLTLMCLLNRHHELPRDRSTLLDRASALLLEQWDLNKSLKLDPELERMSIDAKDKQLILRRVASWMQQANHSKSFAHNAISESQLEKVVQNTLENDLGYENSRNAAVRVVRQLRERNYILCLFGADIYGFVHRSFLDFFCAWDIFAKYTDAPEEQRITLDSLATNCFRKSSLDEGWLEVQRLIINRLNSTDAERVVKLLLEDLKASDSLDPLWLAAECCTDLRTPLKSRELLRIVEFKLRDIIEVPTQKSFSANAASSLEIQNFAYRQAQIRAINLIAKLPLLWAGESWLRAITSSTRNPLVRVAAMNAYCRRVKPVQSVEDWLIRIASPEVGDAIAIVRQAAVRNLAARFPSDKIGEFLEGLAMDTSQDSEVREASHQELLRRWPTLAQHANER